MISFCSDLRKWVGTLTLGIANFPMQNYVSEIIIRMGQVIMVVSFLVDVFAFKTFESFNRVSND